MRGALLTNCARLLPKPLQQLLNRSQSSSFAARLIHGSLWSIAGAMLSRLLALAAALFLARFLGKAIYGQLGIIQATIGMFGGLGGLSMGWAAAKFVAEFRSADPIKAGKIITLASLVSWGTGIGLGVLLFFMAPWVAQSSFGAPELTPYVQLSAALLVLNAVNGTQIGILTGMEAFRPIAQSNGIVGVINFPLVVGGAILFDLSGVVWGMIIAQGLGCFYNAFVWKRESIRLNIPKVSWSRAISEFSLVFRFAVPTTLGTLLINPVMWVCTTMLARQPNGFELVGAYSAASQWFGAIIWLPYVISNAVLPVLSERIGEKDVLRASRLVFSFLKINALLTIPLVIAGSLLSQPIMRAYGESFSSDWPTLVVTLVTCIVVAVQVPVTELITASGRMWLSFSMNLVWAAVFVMMATVLVQWGAVGLASARLLAYTAQCICGGIYVLIWARSCSPRCRGILAVE